MKEKILTLKTRKKTKLSTKQEGRKLTTLEQKSTQWKSNNLIKTEDGMVGRHHQLDGLEFEQAPGVSDGHGSLVCYSPWSRKE